MPDTLDNFIDAGQFESTNRQPLNQSPPHINIMNHDAQTDEKQPPIGLAGLACMVCLGFIYLVAHSVVSWLETWWAGVLIYSVIPLSVVFAILYRSSWHRELPTVTRVLSMILSSSIIFCVALVILFLMVAAVSMFAGFEAGH